MDSFLSSVGRAVAGRQSISAADVAHYHERGFLGPFTAFSAQEMTAAREVIYKRVLSSPNRLDLYPSQARHLDSETVWNLCSAPVIVEQLQRIAGPDLMLWYSNIFDKGREQPMLDGEYPWHQDAWHGDLSVNTVGVWLALTETTPANGCVELIPGTHRSEVTYQRSQDPQYAAWFGGLVANSAELDESRKVAMALQPGQYFIFSERILHHSNPNLTAQRRTGISFRVAAPRFQSDQLEPCVMLSGRDAFGVNRYASPPIGEPDAAADVGELPDAREYRMDMPLFGMGWHLLEQDSNKSFRWTGPERVSWVDLAWRGTGDGQLRCQILHAAAPRLLEGFEIRANGEPVALSWQQADGVIQVVGRVSSTTLANNSGRVRVSLSVVETIRPSSLAPENHDARNIGLAICGLSVSDVLSG